MKYNDVQTFNIQNIIYSVSSCCNTLHDMGLSINQTGNYRLFQIQPGMLKHSSKNEFLSVETVMHLWAKP